MALALLPMAVAPARNREIDARVLWSQRVRMCQIMVAETLKFKMPKECKEKLNGYVQDCCSMSSWRVLNSLAVAWVLDLLNDWAFETLAECNC